jgi:ApeA N-terminal domain 1
MASVGLRGLREFLRGGLQDQALLATSPEDAQGDFITIDMPWGSLGLYIAGGPTHTGQNEVHYGVRAHAQLELDGEATLRRVDELVEPLRDLIAFSTGRPSAVTGLQLLGAPDAEGVHWQHRREFKVVRPPEVPPDHRRLRDFCALMLNPATVPQRGNIIARWYELRASLGPVWPLFFATLADPWMTPESQLLSLTSFAEGYHRTLHNAPPLTDDEQAAAVAAMLAALPDRRHRDHYRSRLQYANSQSQRARIRELAMRALGVATAWDLDARLVCAQAVDTRNWLTHWGDRGQHVQDGDRLEPLLRRLYVILAINLLLDLGLTGQDTARQVGRGLAGQVLP